jgi:phage shock protein PspC (stress-responsive transcriptional regulator)
MEQPPDNERTEPIPDGPESPADPESTHDPKPAADPGPRRLTRSSGDRMISGVCGGIARYFGVDSTVVRIAAVVLALFGGAGALLYVAALLLMPSDDPSAGQAGGNRTLTIVGATLLLLVSAPFILGGGFLAAGLAVPLAMLALAGLLVWWLVSGEGPGGSGRDIARRAALGVGVLVLCGAIATAGALAAGLGGGTVAAALVIAAGAMLIIGAFFGGVRWLIPPALSLALAVGFVSAAGIDLHGGVGERDYRPASANELRDNYRLGMGQLTLDLRNAKLPSGDTHVNLDVGMGEARLIVPEDVCVASAADIGIGAVDVFGRDNGGVDLDWDDSPRAGRGNSRVVVDADLGVGALVVRHDRADENGHGPPFGPNRRFGGRFDDDGDLVGNVGCQAARAAR